MKRRDFLGALSVAAAMRPVASLAQIGVLYGITADDASARARHEAFLEAFQKLGWVDGDNVRIDVRWGEGKPERLEQQAAELIKLSESPSMSHFGREQRSDPIDANGSFRRYSPLVLQPREGPLTSTKAGAQHGRRGLLFMPHTGRSFDSE